MVDFRKARQSGGELAGSLDQPLVLAGGHPGQLQSVRFHFNLVWCRYSQAA